MNDMRTLMEKIETSLNEAVSNNPIIKIEWGDDVKVPVTFNSWENFSKYYSNDPSDDLNELVQNGFIDGDDTTDWDKVEILIPSTEIVNDRFNVLSPRTNNWRPISLENMLMYYGENDENKVVELVNSLDTKGKYEDHDTGLVFALYQ